MLLPKSITKAATIAIFLVLTIAVTFVALPIANAHYPPWTVPNFCYIMISPGTIGVGQTALVVFWVNTYPPTAAGAAGDRWTFYVDVTKPDGTNQTIGPIKSDPIGGGYTAYAPDQVGTYSFVVRFPAQVLTGLPGYVGSPSVPISNAYVNDTYGPSQSHVEYLTVQEQPVQPYQETPLPDGYWTRPISSLNRKWYQATGNWLAWSAAQTMNSTTGFAYGPGPESAHVLWARPVWSGGIADYRFGDIGFSNYHYAGLSFSPPIIIDGKLFYNQPQNPVYGQWCVDLYTGQTLYFRNSTGNVTGNTFGTGFDPYGSITGGNLAYGWVYDPELPNQHGVYDYLISTPSFGGFGFGPTGPQTWSIFDAFTGNWICNVANVSASGTGVYGKDGSYTFYSISGSGANQRLLCWNLSRAIWYKPYYGLYYPATDKGSEKAATTTSNTYWMWRPYLNYTFDGNNGYSINVTMAANPIGSGQTTIRAVREDQFIIGGSTGSNNPGNPIVPGVMWAISLKPGQYGQLLWNNTFTPPSTAGNITVSLAKVDPENHMFIFVSTQTRQFWGYSLDTMQEVWGPDTGVPAENDANYYGMSNYYYQNMLITAGYGGQLRAYDIKTGKILWMYNATSVPFESPYGSNYPINVGCIADGKIYIGVGEHSPTQPEWRGNVLQCINATDGSLIWNFPVFGISQPMGNAGSNFAISDGRLLALNGYDNMIYCFGKGSSGTTVSAPQTVPTLGSSVVITGTVTDQSPSGRLNVNYDLDVALKGTPAISDADMSAWMQYLYQQRPLPANAKGVEVTLDTIDPNGNFVHIGTVTTDTSGNYGYKFTPEVPGTFQIIATFAGSKSYGPSFATTYLAVDEAPPPTAPPEYPQPIDPTMTIVYAAIAIIIAIAIVGIVGILILRKK